MKAYRTVHNITLYVESVNNTGKGDKYSYTRKADNALDLTKWQAERFLSYMKQCGTQGYVVK